MERLFLKFRCCVLKAKLAVLDVIANATRKPIGRFVAKQVTPFMVPGIQVHEANTWLTIRYGNPMKSVRVSLADLRSAPLDIVIGDGEGVVEIEIETTACTAPNGVAPAKVLACGGRE